MGDLNLELQKRCLFKFYYLKKFRLRISAWDSLMNQVEGLCGNYDGNPDNDFPRQEDEELIANVNRFVSSWLITGRDLNG